MDAELRSTARWLVAVVVLASGCGERFSGADGGGGTSSGTAAGGAGVGGGTTSSTLTTGAGGAPTTTSTGTGGAGATTGTGGGGGSGTWGLPVVLAENQLGPWGITCDPSGIYWTNEGDGKIFAMPLAGGAATLITTGTHPRGIADWAGILGWADPGSHAGCRGSTSGGSYSCTGPPGGEPEDAAVSTALTVYFTAPGIGTVESWNGTMSVEVATGQAQPLGITVDAVHVYWANGGSNRIMRIPLAGGQPTEFATTSGPPQHVMSGTLGVFWTVPTLGRVEGRTVGSVPVIVTTEPGQPWDIVSDGARLCWTNRTEGMVRCALADGAGLETIAEGLEEPIGITVGSTSFYWTDYGAGKIYKADRPL